MIARQLLDPGASNEEIAQLKIQLLLPVIFLCSSFTAYAQETVGKVDWDYVYVDLHTSCNRSYSLFPPTVKCIEDRLFAVRYKVSYDFHGMRREVYLDYIPDENTRVDASGNLEPRNHAVKERY